jgi:hypothetical protein
MWTLFDDHKWDLHFSNWYWTSKNPHCSPRHGHLSPCAHRQRGSCSHASSAAASSARNETNSAPSRSPLPAPKRALEMQQQKSAQHEKACAQRKVEAQLAAFQGSHSSQHAAQIYIRTYQKGEGGAPTHLREAAACLHNRESTHLR